MQKFYPSCCPMCAKYIKFPEQDFCCRTCRDTKGQYHGSGCTYTPCVQPTITSTPKVATTTSSCCPTCNVYKPYPQKDNCCLTCRDTRGKSHGQGCLRDPCITNCTNLTNGQYLYDPNSTICFYNNKEPFYVFTNFYPAPITILGIMYPTSEHYFQAQKFSDSNIIKEIISDQSPSHAFNTARKFSQFIRSDWHKGYKLTAMKNALVEKFTQNKELGKILVSTGNKKLVEHTTNDDYWGDNGDGKGQNQLGKLLEELRTKLSQTKGGSADGDYQKYLKYKNKYLGLKNSN